MKKKAKFLASTVAVSMVAAAITPTAFAQGFSDTKGNTHGEAINSLVKLGVISGYPDGTFKPNKTLTRSDVVKLLGKYLVAQNYKVPADYKTNVRFSDITPKNADDELLKYAAMIKDNGILGGSNGRLLAKEDMTREDMAIALVKVINVVEGVDLVQHVSSQNYENDVKDLTSAKASARPFIAVLDYFDITNPDLNKFNPKDTTTRGQFATFLNRSIAMNLAEIKNKPYSITSFKGIGKQALSVTLNKEIDLVKAKLIIKKSGVEIDITKTELSSDKRTLNIYLSSNLTAGVYDLSLTGLAENVLTASTSLVNEKVDSIEILGSAAVLNSTNTKLKIPYRVYNQYKEDITAKVNSLKVSSNLISTKHSLTIKPEEGLIEVTKLNGNDIFKLGEKVSLTIEDGVIKGTKSLTVSEKSRVSQVVISKLYNDVDSTATLSLDSTYEDFHLVLSAIDQYGIPMPSTEISNDILVSISDTSIIDVNSSTSAPKFTDITIDGKKQTVIELKEPKNKKAGQASITLTSRSTGKSSKFDLVVGMGIKADQISFQAPDLVIAGEKTEIPYLVIGADGKQISDTKLLNSSNGVRLTTSDPNVKVTFETDSRTGKAKLYITDSSQATSDRQVLISTTTASGKSNSVIVNIRAKAEAAKITGVNNLETTLLVGGTEIIKPDSFKIEDQYGRNISLSASNMASAANVANAGKYYIKVDSFDDKVALSANRMLSATNTVTATGLKKGTNFIKFTIQQIDSRGIIQTKESSSYEAGFRIIEKADIVTYEMKDIEPIYDNPVSSAVSNYKRDVIIYGKTSSGNRVIVPTSEYTVVTSNPDLVYEASNSTIYVRPTKDIVDKEDIQAIVRIIINAEQQPVTLDKTVTITKSAPYAKKIELQPSFKGLTIRDSILQIPGTTGIVSVDSAALRGILKITDQYGEDISLSASERITITATNLVNSDNDTIVPKVSGNGTNTLNFSGIETGDSFYLTYVVDGNMLTTYVIIGQ